MTFSRRSHGVPASAPGPRQWAARWGESAPPGSSSVPARADAECYVMLEVQTRVLGMKRPEWVRVSHLFQCGLDDIGGPGARSRRSRVRESRTLGSVGAKAEWLSHPTIPPS